MRKMGKWKEQKCSCFYSMSVKHSRAEDTKLNRETQNFYL